jgi:hypothetical protein
LLKVIDKKIEDAKEGRALTLQPAQREENQKAKKQKDAEKRKKEQERQDQRLKEANLKAFRKVH